MPLPHGMDYTDGALRVDLNEFTIGGAHDARDASIPLRFNFLMIPLFSLALFLDLILRPSICAMPALVVPTFDLLLSLFPEGFITLYRCHELWSPRNALPNPSCLADVVSELFSRPDGTQIFPSSLCSHCAQWGAEGFDLADSTTNVRRKLRFGVRELHVALSYVFLSFMSWTLGQHTQRKFSIPIFAATHTALHAMYLIRQYSTESFGWCPDGTWAPKKRFIFLEFRVPRRFVSMVGPDLFAFASEEYLRGHSDKLTVPQRVRNSLVECVKNSPRADFVRPFSESSSIDMLPVRSEVYPIGSAVETHFRIAVEKCLRGRGYLKARFWNPQRNMWVWRFYQELLALAEAWHLIWHRESAINRRLLKLGFVRIRGYRPDLAVLTHLATYMPTKKEHDLGILENLEYFNFFSTLEKLK